MCPDSFDEFDQDGKSKYSQWDPPWKDCWPTYFRLPKTAEYLASVDARPTALLTAVKCEPYPGSYRTRETARIIISRDGKVEVIGDVKPPEGPLADEIEREIKAAAPSLPALWHAFHLDGLPEPMARAQREGRLFVFKEHLPKAVVGTKEPLTGFCQERINLPDGGKSYVPWSLWSIPGSGVKWYRTALPGKNPLFNQPALRDAVKVFIHEGAKAAQHCHWMTEKQWVDKRFVDRRSDEAKKALAAHPWGKQLSNAAHVGWIGGVHVPYATDWEPILGLDRDTRIFVVADRDEDGGGAIAAHKIAQMLMFQYHFKNVRVVEFPKHFEDHFDLADPFPLPAPDFGACCFLPRYMGDAGAPETQPAVDAVTARLNERGLAFQFAGIAALILREASGVLKTKDGKPAVFARACSAKRDALIGPVEKISQWSKWNGAKKRTVATKVPAWVPNIIIARGGEDLPPLRGVAECPVYMAGDLVQGRSGYHRETCLYLDSDPVEIETFDDPAKAVHFLKDWLAAFPFKSDDDAVRALLLPLTLLTRRTVIRDGAGAPLFFVTSPEQNTGKTHLVRCLCAAITGVQPGISTFTMDDVEFRKNLFAILLESPVAVLFDNLPNGASIRNEPLERYASGDTYQDRQLGVSKSPTVPALSVLVFTGNNIEPAGDMRTRSVEIRMERKSDRSRDIEAAFEKTLKLRGGILGALLAILRSGPIDGEEPVSRFPSWDRYVAHPLMKAADKPKLLGHFQEVMTEGTDDDSPLAWLMEEMLKKQSGDGWFTAQGLIDACPDRLSELLGKPKGEPLIAMHVTKPLKAFKDKLAGGMRFRMDQTSKADDKRRKVSRFRAEPVDNTDEAAM